jgi:CubicO group peptidase (beta-lactamase class C family)
MLDGPDGDFRIALVDVNAKSAEAGAASAWKAVFPDFNRPLKIAQERPARQGWDERRSLEYETSPNERLVVFADARRKGEGWTVILVRASQPAFEKRVSQLQLVLDSLRPSGYARESFAGKSARALDAARVKEITDFVNKARDAAVVPGVAVALVQGDRLVFEGGFGVRELGKAAPVDADTLFLIASNTKAMSTLLLAKLVDEGKLGWDTPVTSVYPSFKLGDAETTSKVLVKHLVCACTGMPRQDFEWLFEFKSATAKSEMDLLGTMQPTSKFGEVYQYSNVLAAAAGFLGASMIYPNKELGAAYDGAMKAKVFEPLGMRETTFDFKGALAGNHASGHARDPDGKTLLASMDINRAIIPLRPAGGAWSSVKDVAKYVQMELAKGKLPDGKPYIGEQALLARRTPQVAAGEDRTYGMGLEVDTEWGVPVVHHGGSLFGFKSDMFWLPDHGVGGVILTNADAGRMMLKPFLCKTLEVLFDGKAEATEDLALAVKRYNDYRAKERERLVIPADAEIVAKLAPRYENRVLGEIVVNSGATPSGKSAQTVLDLGEWKSTGASRKNDDDTISLMTILPGVEGFELVVAEREGKRALVLRDMQHEYVFVEKK